MAYCSRDYAIYIYQLNVLGQINSFDELMVPKNKEKYVNTSKRKNEEKNKENGKPTENDGPNAKASSVTYSREGNFLYASWIVDYVIRHVLHWTPQEAVVNLNHDIVETLLLDKVIKCVDDELKLDKNDYRWLLSKIYPKEVHYNFAEETLGYWKKALEYTIRRTKTSYPSGFFAYEKRGKDRAITIMDYLLSEYFQDATLPEIYRFFGDADNRDRLNEFVSKYKLKLILDSGLYKEYIDLVNDTLRNKFENAGDKKMVAENNIVYLATRVKCATEGIENCGRLRSLPGFKTFKPAKAMTLSFIQ